MSKRRDVAVIAGLLLMVACQSRVKLAAPDIDDREIPLEHRIAMAESIVQHHLELEQRVLTVSHRLRVASAGACSPQVAPMLGVLEDSRSGFYDDPIFEQAAANRLGVLDGKTIVWLLPGGPMERAGAQVGDEFVRVGGRWVGTKDPSDLAAKYAAKSSEPIPIQLRRRGKPVDLQIEQALGCSGTNQLYWSSNLCFGLSFKRLSRKPARWAYSPYVCTALLEFVRSDDELAALISHVLAHQILETTGKPKTARRYRTVRRMVVARELELRADELSLELLAGAGFDVTAAPKVFERFALEYPQTIVLKPESVAFGHHWRIAERLPPMRRHVERLLESRTSDGSELPENAPE